MHSRDTYWPVREASPSDAADQVTGRMGKRPKSMSDSEMRLVDVDRSPASAGEAMILISPRLPCMTERL